MVEPKVSMMAVESVELKAAVKVATMVVMMDCLMVGLMVAMTVVVKAVKLAEQKVGVMAA